VPAGNLDVDALHEVTGAARHAAVAIAAEPSDRDPVADGEPLDPGSEIGDGSRNLVARRQRPRQTGETTGDESMVGAADPARGDRDTHMPRRRVAIADLTTPYPWGP